VASPPQLELLGCDREVWQGGRTRQASGRGRELLGADDRAVHAQLLGPVDQGVVEAHLQTGVVGVDRHSRSGDGGLWAVIEEVVAGVLHLDRSVGVEAAGRGGVDQPEGEELSDAALLVPGCQFRSNGPRHCRSGNLA